MNNLNIEDINHYVESNIGLFHQKRIDKINALMLKDVLEKKNPYLFRAKNVLIATDLVKGIVDAFVSSSEEGIFGDWLEGLAIFVNEKVYNGWKSGIPGIDLEFDSNGMRNLVSIKSGPNWGNHGQYKKMIDNFNSARKVLNTSGGTIHVKAINGCCYGKSSKRFEYKKNGDYYKFCGQSFWEFISGDDELYKNIIIPLGYKAREINEEFYESYSQTINMFTDQFSDEFCKDGLIDWQKLMEFNSQCRR